MKKFILFILLSNIWTNKVMSFDKAQVEINPVASSNDDIPYTYASFYSLDDQNDYALQAAKPEDCYVSFPRRSASGQKLYDEISNTTLMIQNGLCGAVSVDDTVTQPYKNLVWEEVPKLGYSGGIDGTGGFTVDGYYLRLTAKNPYVKSLFIDCINSHYFPAINTYNQDRASCMNVGIIPIITVIGGGAVLFMIVLTAYRHRERIASGLSRCRRNIDSFHLSEFSHSLIRSHRRRDSNVLNLDDKEAINLQDLDRSRQRLLDQIPPPPSSPTSFER